MSLQFRLTMNTPALNALIAKVTTMQDSSRLAAGMRELGLLMQRNIVVRTPRRTGGAAGAVQLKSVSATQVVVAGALSYWPPLEEGSRAHVIAPKNAKVLAFKTKSGNQVFARKVMHPGTRGIHAFRDGIKDTEPRVLQILMKHVGLK